MPFVQASGPSDVRLSTSSIQRTLEALVERGHDDVLLASHDGDFAPQVAALLREPGRRVGVLGFASS